MATFMLRIVYIIYLIVMVLPASSLCIECSSSMDDDKIYYYNDSVILPVESYCFVNECTIRIKESNVLLNVINNTGDWIIATNTTNMLTIFINDSINNCSSDDTEANAYQFDTTLYIIQFILYSIGIAAGVANIIMHLVYKELRTVSGILIIILCTITCIALLISTLRITINYYQIDGPERICSLFYMLYYALSRNTYEAAKTTILLHLSYTMYRSYRVMGGWMNERSLLWRYISFIILSSTVSAAIIIIVEVSTDSADIQCGNRVSDYYKEAEQLPIHVIIRFANFLIWLFVQLVLITIVLVLYFLTTKKCCATSLTSRNFRVSVILIATADLRVSVAITLLILDIPKHIIPFISLAFIVVEQLALFTLFATSSKVKCFCMGKREQYSTSNS